MRAEVLLPVLVEHVQHQVLLELARMFSAPICASLSREVPGHGVLHGLGDGSVVQLFAAGIQRPERSVCSRNRSLQRLLEAGQVPLLVDRVRAARTGATCSATTSSRMPSMVSCHDLGFQQFVALLVDHLALVVGDVVVFEQVLADVEVVRLDLALRVLRSAW